MIRSTIVSLCLSLSPTAFAGETIVVPVNDIIMTIPDFDNAPQYSMNGALFGGTPFNDNQPARRESRRDRERRLIELVEEMYPDAIVRIYNGNLIVRFP